ncbi:hypothetical protein DL93DRAFT_2054702 [Clavulina sp. PMI_390]|nr:hypothetical protein DL93DRAFT_2054702 [Clavulina sp. PMI_390]
MPRRPSPNPSSAAAAVVEEADLLGGGGGEPGRLAIPSSSSSKQGGYISPHRRRPGRDATPASSSAPTPSSSRPSTSSRANPAPAPVKKVTRTLVSASPSALSQSQSQRQKGTSAFKLGSYGDAEAAYSSAIALLPAGHILLVPLMNNRAAARAKTGDTRGAVEDCTKVLRIVDEPYSSSSAFHPSKEDTLSPLMIDGETVSVDFADAYVKALQRRAQAYEGMEKWDAARGDWERLVGADWREAGAAASARPTPASAPPRPKPRPKPSLANDLASVSNQDDSQGVAKLRAAAQTQESEDVQRIALKDSVDTKLLAWKGGKETNLRALIASLENVLWPELGWVKVGLHELVTPNQVKIRYMKAIGRVHPDKLSAMNTTVEQRMIANGVFGALNEAWNAFKP